MIMGVSGNTGLIFNIGEQGCGKSFLLNQVMDVEGFQPKEKGIKLWSKAFYRDDENLNLFFVDVEGFGKDEKFNNFVWSLAFLTGTIIIYSSNGMEEHNLALMNSFEFLNKFLVISNDEVENGYMMSYYAPKFIWLAKDHLIEERDTNGKQMLPDKYMEMILNEETNNPSIEYTKRFLINIIKDRTCISFETLDNPRFNNPQLDELYTYNLSVLREKIYSRSFNKYFDGVSFSSRMLINFISGFIELFNNDKYIEYHDM